MNQNEIIELAVATMKRAGVYDSVSVIYDFDLKGTSAGRCSHTDGRSDIKLSFNMPIAALNVADFAATVVHEVAHLVDFVRNGMKMRRNPNGTRNMHGASWKCIMMELGIQQPKTCHSYELPAATLVKGVQRRWEYRCACAVAHKIATVTHNRIQQGQRRICKSCKQDIQYTGVQL